MVKNTVNIHAANAGEARDKVLIPGGGNGSPLQYSCLENFMGRGAWQVTVHRVAKSQTLLSLSLEKPLILRKIEGKSRRG